MKVIDFKLGQQFFFGKFIPLVGRPESFIHMRSHKNIDVSSEFIIET